MDAREKLVDLKPCPFCGGLRMDAFWDEFLTEEEAIEARKDYPYYSLPTGVPRKTQIQADIMRLRRELLALSKMLDE